MSFMDSGLEVDFQAVFRRLGFTDIWILGIHLVRGFMDFGVLWSQCGSHGPGLIWYSGPNGSGSNEKGPNVRNEPNGLKGPNGPTGSMGPMGWAQFSMDQLKLYEARWPPGSLHHGAGVLHDIKVMLTACRRRFFPSP